MRAALMRANAPRVDKPSDKRARKGLQYANLLKARAAVKKKRK